MKFTEASFKKAFTELSAFMQNQFPNISGHIAHVETIISFRRKPIYFQ